MLVLTNLINQLSTSGCVLSVIFKYLLASTDNIQGSETTVIGQEAITIALCCTISVLPIPTYT